MLSGSSAFTKLTKSGGIEIVDSNTLTSPPFMKQFVIQGKQFTCKISEIEAADPFNGARKGYIKPPS